MHHYTVVHALQMTNDKHDLHASDMLTRVVVPPEPGGGWVPKKRTLFHLVSAPSGAGTLCLALARSSMRNGALRSEAPGVAQRWGTVLSDPQAESGRSTAE